MPSPSGTAPYPAASVNIDTRVAQNHAQGEGCVCVGGGRDVCVCVCGGLFVCVLCVCVSVWIEKCVPVYVSACFCLCVGNCLCVQMCECISMHLCVREDISCRRCGWVVLCVCVCVCVCEC